MHELRICISNEVFIKCYSLIYFLTLDTTWHVYMSSHRSVVYAVELYNLKWKMIYLNI